MILFLGQSAAARSAAASAAAAAAAAAKIATKPAITLKIGPKTTPKMGPASKIGPASSKIAPKAAVTNSGRPVRKVVYKEEPGKFLQSNLLTYTRSLKLTQFHVLCL